MKYKLVASTMLAVIVASAFAVTVVWPPCAENSQLAENGCKTKSCCTTFCNISCGGTGGSQLSQCLSNCTAIWG
jgi:hypothetical protein